MKKLGKFFVGLLLVAAMALCLVACEDPVVIEKISIGKAPAKVVYWEGETFDATGMEIKVTKSNGETETVTEGYIVDKTEPLTKADTKVTVTYEGFTATQKITVNENVETLVISQLPSKIDYTTDKTVDLTGVKASVNDLKGNVTELTASDLTAALDGDVVTLKYKDYSYSYTVKTETLPVANIGSQDWYGTTNQPNLFGTWDIADDGATLPNVDATAGTVTFTAENWSRLPIFCVKYPKNDGTIFENGNNIGAEVNNHVDGQQFNYSLNVQADGEFRMGFLLANSALQGLTDSWAMGLMLHFNGNKLTLATAEGGGTANVLAEADTQFENGKTNRVDFSFKRVENLVTYQVWVNGIRVYWQNVSVDSHPNAALDNGNFTFKAGRYEDDEAASKVDTGYKNYGNRFGIYAESGTTVVLSNVA